jgi:hypothetical protein
MPRPRTKPPTSKTTVELENYKVVKEYCAFRGITIREYLNLLISNDIMFNGNEYFSTRYFKQPE